ncbi:MAG: hypothetical protein AVDCRST_MAG30-2354, partial [uncultured Solirubrobacteraceae bacterium]
MPERFREPPDGSGMWKQPWLVRCPRCAERASVVEVPAPSRSRLVCPNCGLAREGIAGLTYDGRVCQQVGRRGPWRRTWVPRQHWPLPRSEAYALWLQESGCGGQVVSASNAEHL